jgi:hypothetical protein
MGSRPGVIPKRADTIFKPGAGQRSLVIYLIHAHRKAKGDNLFCLSDHGHFNAACCRHLAITTAAVADDRTERRRRPSASALATDVARPRSLQ